VKKHKGINIFGRSAKKKTKLSKFHMVFANCEAKTFGKPFGLHMMKKENVVSLHITKLYL
jgi:hypothetical protein